MIVNFVREFYAKCNRTGGSYFEYAPLRIDVCKNDTLSSGKADKDSVWEPLDQ